MRFDDKVILITGGGSGLGRECALWWAEAGGTIVVTDLIEKRATDVAAEITVQVRDRDRHQGRRDRRVGGRGRRRPDGRAVRSARRHVRQRREDQPRAWAPSPSTRLPTSSGRRRRRRLQGRVLRRQARGPGHEPAGRGNIVVTTSAGGINAYPGLRRLLRGQGRRDRPGPQHGLRVRPVRHPVSTVSRRCTACRSTSGSTRRPTSSACPTRSSAPSRPAARGTPARSSPVRSRWAGRRTCATTPPSPRSSRPTTRSTCPASSSRPVTAGPSRARPFRSPSSGRSPTRSESS